MNLNVQEQPQLVTLKGFLVQLRPLDKRTDLDICLKWMNDPEITQFLIVDIPTSRDEEEAWFDKQKDRANGKIFAIVTLDGNRHIGNIGLHTIDHKHGTATTGTVIGEKDYWGKGYGTDAKMVLMNYAFNVLNLRRLTSEVIAFNGRSANYAQKCGYVLEGTLRQHVYVNGAYHDAFVFGALKEE